MTSTDEQNKSKAQRVKAGVVSSISGDKTIAVMVSTVVKHPRYGKYVNQRTRYAVHDPSNQAGLGDKVEITPCRPISKNKSWRLLRVVRSDATTQA